MNIMEEEALELLHENTIIVMKLFKLIALVLLLPVISQGQYLGGGGSGDAKGTVSDSSLPVVFTSFTASCLGQAIQLKWQTASETENNFFGIERSQDGKAWHSIGKVKGNGNTSSFSEYSYTDTKPFSMMSYYRLKQMDLDGSFEHSKSVSVTLCPRDGIDAITIFPNPGRGIFKVLGIRENSYLTVTNPIGVTIMAFISTENFAEVDLTNQPAGIYFLRINQAATRKIVLH